MSAHGPIVIHSIPDLKTAHHHSIFLESRIQWIIETNSHQNSVLTSPSNSYLYQTEHKQQLYLHMLSFMFEKILYMYALLGPPHQHVHHLQVMSTTNPIQTAFSCGAAEAGLCSCANSAKYCKTPSCVILSCWQPPAMCAPPSSLMAIDHAYHSYAVS